MPNDEKFYTHLIVVLGQITTAAMVIPLVVAVARWRLLTSPLRIFFWSRLALVVSASFELLFIEVVTRYQDFWVPYLNKWQISDTNFLQITSQLPTFLLIGWFYSSLLSTYEKKAYNIVWLISIGLALTAVINYLFIEGFRVHGTLNPLMLSLFLISIPMIYLFFLAKTPFGIPLSKTPYFWISVGILLVNLLSLFFSTTGNKLYLTDYVLYAKFLIARNAISVLAQFIFAYAFYQAKYARLIHLSDSPIN
ncbi:hypothetical protein DR864_15800 [Runella rosea]|uniref:Uncharacterized protein n=1 Tax=Runella rosea TaxID=2259595 RepID=A0A344TKD8_9BACT|nr:hypothetical protein [Runella rosea]AXE19109.1 hypothetical protein DR864_15800 [Runella rosea]